MVEALGYYPELFARIRVFMLIDQNLLVPDPVEISSA